MEGKTKSTVVGHGRTTREMERGTTDIVDQETGDFQTWERMLDEGANGLRERRKCREENLGRCLNHSLNEGLLTSLDSSMKKNAALVRKLKQVNEGNVDSIVSDIKKTNQSKYVSEAAQAIAEAQLKMKDVPAAVKICSVLHQRYPDEFCAMLMREHEKGVLDVAGSGGLRRIRLRLFIELVLVGVYNSVNIVKDLLGILMVLTRVKAKSGSDEYLKSLSLVNAFVKAGLWHLFDIPCPSICGVSDDRIVEEASRQGNDEGRKLKDALAMYKEEESLAWRLPEKERHKLGEIVSEFFDKGCQCLEDSFQELKRIEVKNEEILNTKGDVQEGRQELLKVKRLDFDSMLRSMETLAETLGKSLPTMEVDEPGQEDVVAQIGTEFQQLFDDPEDRAMYLGLPSLSAVVPSVLLGRGDAATSFSNVEKMETDEGVDIDEETLSVVSSEEEEELSDSGQDQDEKKIQLGAVLARLPECVTIDDCDSFALDFVYSGGVKERSQKKLARVLGKPPHGALQLLPFYSRIVAILCPEFPLIKDILIKNLQKEFYGLKKRKEISKALLEPRLRNASYIAELVKFGIYPPGRAFVHLKSLLEDFSRDNIDTACCLVERCGKYLYKRSDTTIRMDNMMKIMMKMKNARNIDERHVMLIDSAYATVYDTTRVIEKKQRTPVQEYIRHLIYCKLSSSTIQTVEIQLLKLNWSDDEAQYVLKIMMGAVRKGKSDIVPVIAALCKRLSAYYPSLRMLVIDEVMEEIMMGMERPNPLFNQRRLSMIAFLAQLHAERLAPSILIFNTLMMLLNDNARSDNNVDFYFQLKLICKLVSSCHQFFLKGPGARRLQSEYLPYFAERCVLYRPLPLDIELDIEDMYSRIQLDPLEYKTLEDARSALQELETKKKKKQLTIEEYDDDKYSEASIIVKNEYGDDIGENDEFNASSDSDAEDGIPSGSMSTEDEQDQGSDDDPDMHRNIKEWSELEEEFDRELALAFGPIAPQGSNISPVDLNLSKKPRKQTSSKETMSLCLMTRKGGRSDKSRALSIPVPAGVAQKMRQRKDEEAQEKAAIKKMVLKSSVISE